MNVNKNKRGVVEVAIVTALICVFAIAGMYIPWLSIPLFVIPAPLIILGKKYGIKYSLMSLVAASLVVMSFSSPITTLIYIIFPGFMAIVIGIFMQKKYKHMAIIAAGTIASILASVISIYIIAQITGISFVENIQQMFKQSSEIQEYMYSITKTDKDTIEKAKEMMVSTQEKILLIVPALIVLQAFIFCLINYFLSLFILKRTGYSVQDVKPFRYFRLPRNILYGLLVSLTISLIAVQLNIVDQKITLTNLYLLYRLVFAVQGWAVVVYYLKYYKVNKIFMVLIGVFLVMSGMEALFIVGVLDMFLDFRKYRSENKSKF